MLVLLSNQSLTVALSTALIRAVLQVPEIEEHFRCFFFFLTLITSPRRSLSLKLSDSRVYEQIIHFRVGQEISRNFGVSQEIRSVRQVLEMEELLLLAMADNSVWGGSQGPCSATLADTALCAYSH